ncbi:hypothetical protein SLEP1_g9620 [Rubroshorea leprosula]|uniref:Uncharacterized protein n=1 Tax=Rubroshorea leprosula TaxID=152421 RepID=A0AAV5IDF1_9ROSI|nr:hypothetical protein SLEP1_g9620 [Rubroshorea leprosula]
MIWKILPPCNLLPIFCRVEEIEDGDGDGSAVGGVVVISDGGGAKAGNLI